MHPTLRLRLATAAAACLLVPGAGIALAGPAAAATARPTTTTIATVHPTVGKAATLTATVSPAPSGGTVAFTDAGKVLSGCATAALKSGKATCKVTFRTAGKHAVAAKYSGRTGAYASSTGKATITVAAAPATVGQVVGSTGSCTTAKGALAAVDFAHWSGPIVRGCGTTLSTARALLTAAGFSVANVARFPGFICRLGHPLFNSGAGYPTSAQDPCVNTPPASAYWSFWTAAKGVNTWTYSATGADSDHPIDGEVEAWTFGSTDISGTTGKPTFTPAQIRTGLPTASMSPARRRAPAGQPGATPKTEKGAQYLVDQLTGGTHYEQFGYPDLGLTIDGAFSLAAAGFDTQLTAVTGYIRSHQDDFTYLDQYGGAFASGGAVGKIALLAEATGDDPRSYGGVDLIAAMHRLTCTKADATKQCAAKGNYQMSSSVFAQALGVLGQLRAGDTAAAAAPIGYLESLQKSNGGFPSLIGTASPAETDSTAMAAMTLALVHGAKARTALTKALGWLAEQQVSDGGFPGAAGDSVNSAALAVQALHLDAEKYAAEITKGEAFLAAEQNDDGGYDLAAGADGSDLRSSTQAVIGATGIPFTSVLDELPAKAAAAKGGDYLVSQLVDGDHYNFDGSTFPDSGLTADAVFALLGSGGHHDDVTKMVDFLRSNVDSYADTSGSFGGPYSGGLAKLALVAESTGGDPHAFGGADLLGLITSKVCTAPSGGQYPACTAAGDFFNAASEISQALGVLALQASPVSGDHLTATSPAVVRLHQLQCADGGFTSELIVAGQKCDSDVDATGYAVQALAAVPGTDLWLGRAQHFLENEQRDSGLYRGTAGDNSNSTALAAQGLQTLVTALHSATVDPPGPKTITPIVNWQSALHGLVGLAVADGGGFGVSTDTTPDVRATTQAVSAAAQRSLFALSGARYASTPRDPASATTGSGVGGVRTSSPTAGATVPAAAGNRVGGNLADTGVASGDQLLLALLLLTSGAGLAYAGRRRVAGAMGRHRHR